MTRREKPLIICFPSMSTMRLMFLLMNILFFNYCYSNEDFIFQIQPQSVVINNLDEKYITSDNHYIGQVLYRYDQVKLACDCQTELNHTEYYIYWTINNKTWNKLNNSNRIELFIDINTVQVPITYVTCYCVFIQFDFRRIKKSYQYQLYIDLESEPSLKPINYSVQSSVIKEHWNSFIQHHLFMIPIFTFIIIGITCPLIILSFRR